MAMFKFELVRPDVVQGDTKQPKSSPKSAGLKDKPLVPSNIKNLVQKTKQMTTGKISDIKASQSQIVKRPIIKPKYKSDISQSKTYQEIAKNRRPSIEIAKSFVELNLKTIVDLEREPKLTKEEKKQLKKQKRIENRRRFRKLKIFVAFMMLMLISVGIANLWWRTSTQPVNPDDTGSYRFEVARGATSAQVADALVKGGFIRNSLAYRIYLRWTGYVVQAGTHMLSPSYTLQEIASKLTEASTEEISIQIPPGLDLGQLRDVFRRNGFSDEEIDRAFNADYNNAILQGRPSGATLEGYIFPETYRIFAGDSLETLIQRSLDEFERVVAENNLEQRFADMGLTFHEGLTLASIVSLEVRNSDEQKKVASVFHNRLNRIPPMSLGADPTFRYAFRNGLCPVNGPSCDSIYNTRIHAGLPPSPIANVGAQALIATANPSATDYLFFVSGDDGITRFSRTNEEHERLTAIYCRELCLL